VDSSGPIAVANHPVSATYLCYQRMKLEIDNENILNNKVKMQVGRVARLFCDRRKFDPTLVSIDVCAADDSAPATFVHPT
jgi:hypothetical protein